MLWSGLLGRVGVAVALGVGACSLLPVRLGAGQPVVGGPEPESSITVRSGEMPPMEFSLIPAGSFKMGDPSYGGGGTPWKLFVIFFGHGTSSLNDAGPVRDITISSRFYLGRTKVTVAQYCAFLNEIDEPERYIVFNRGARLKRNEGRYTPLDGMADCEVNTVPWVGAEAYCAWLSERTELVCRLPTEAEWEWAARGEEGRKYPWGGEFDADAEYGRDGCDAGGYPANSTPEGVRGMAGSIAEWCSDWYAASYDPEELIDPRGPPDGEARVLRGREAVAYKRTSQTPTKAGVQAAGAWFFSFRVLVETRPSD